MKKHPAWTLAELVIAIIIVIILALACISNFKPNVQKTKIFAYALLKNISTANLRVMDENEQMLDNELFEEDPSNTDDWYCLHLANTFNLTRPASCAKTLGENDVNITLPNGAQLMGVASAWVQRDGDEYKVKNILVDIDGTENGLNRIWVDRFPLRIYSGSIYSGQVQVTNCADEAANNKYSYNSPYCNNISVATAADDSIISYDVYRPETSDEVSKAEPVFTSLSSMKADCLAYGGTGFYKGRQCQDNGFRMTSKCATIQNCAMCDIPASEGVDAYNVCPDRDKDGNPKSTTVDACSELALSENPEDLNCFTMIHKPNAGTTFLLESLLINIDE